MSFVWNINNIQRIRLAHKSNMLWTRLMTSSSTPIPTKPVAPKPPSENENSIPGVSTNRANYKPDNLEKRFLVWTGKYKSIDQVPEFIYQETMERTRNKIRIRGANIMIVLTVLGCIGMIYSGKQAAKSGQSVEQYNLDWHKKYNEDNKIKTASE